MSEIEKATADAVLAARQSEDYAALLATIRAEMEQRQQGPQIVHVHQAQPDRTIQRLALGAGLGAGAVAGAVYFGPLLIASLTTMAVIVLAGALAIAVLAWAIVHVVTGVRPEPKGKRR
ncbi:DUF6251 family protein [Streptomyces sp. NPDC088197]|uniref:DUF6251 family protein n=1 Tax=Streptomyces sp. NPDC088197 TaxID=3365840 RepID=UPI0038261D43